MALTIYRDCIAQMDEARLLSLGGKSPSGKTMTKGVTIHEMTAGHNYKIVITEHVGV